MSVLDNHIMDLEKKIVDAGEYIEAVTEGMVNEGTIKYSDGTVITDPVEKADEIIKVASEIKEMAIKYRALTDVDNDIYDQNKKAVISASFGERCTNNDQQKMKNQVNKKTYCQQQQDRKLLLI